MILLSVEPLFPEASESGEDLFLERAERMNRRVEEGRVVLYLFGDVTWRKGETEITSETATYREDERWLRLTQDVWVREPERTIHADTVDYYEEGDSAVARGNVIMLSGDNDQQLDTTHLLYLRDGERMIAFHRPLITIKRKPEEEDTTSFAIRGDRVVSCGEDSLFVVGEVTVEGDSLSADCDSAFYDLKNDWIRMRGEPVIRVTGSTSWGDGVDLFVPDDRLTGAVVRGDAKALGKKVLKEDEEITGEERYRLVADSLVLSFEEEKLKMLSAFSHASSLVEKEDLEKKVEKNYVTGNAIVIGIEDGKVEKVEVKGDGKGVYVMPAENEKTNVDRVR